MMNKYTLQTQRDNYITTLRNDVRLKEYPRKDHIRPFDQYAGLSLLKERYNDVLARLGLNIALPFMMLSSDVMLTAKYLWRYVNRRVIVLESGRYFLNHEKNLYNISKRIGMQDDGDVWVRSPFDYYRLPEDKNTLEAADLVTVKEIFLSTIQAIMLHIRAVVEFGYDKYLLSYKAYEWCLYDFALRHLPTTAEIVYSCIYDRQAIMYDKLPQQNKTMIQHGGMFCCHKIVPESPYYEWQEDRKFYVPCGYYKSSPYKVYCFTEDDEVALMRSVIANNPQFVHIGYGFKPTFGSERKSVLIVGYYIMKAEDEKRVIAGLQGLDIDIYLKNHPTLSDDLYDEIRKTYVFHFIPGMSTEMPDADLVISYESTLAYQYKSIGTKVLFYEDIDLDRIRTIVSDELQLD